MKDETIRKGERVTGLLDVRKVSIISFNISPHILTCFQGGALLEFISVDRHRIHRAPFPVASPPPEATSAVSSSSTTTTSTSSGSSSLTAKPAPPTTLTVEHKQHFYPCAVSSLPSSPHSNAKPHQTPGQHSPRSGSRSTYC